MTHFPQNAKEVRAFITWMGDDGICRTVTKPQAEIGIAEAMENSVTVSGFYTTRKFPLMVDTRSIRSISREARKHFSTSGRDTAINSMAIIVDSPISRVVGNFFMGLNKPPVPAKLFNSENEAVIWLKQFV